MNRSRRYMRNLFHFYGMKIRSALLILGPALLLNACASKSDLVVVSDDVKKLRNESESVKSQSAASYSDVQQLRDEVAQLKGILEESRYKNQQTFGRLGLEDSLLVQKMDNIDTRLSRLEQQLGVPSQKSSAMKPATLPAASQGAVKAPVSSDSALLNDGVQKLGKGSYASARESFTALMQAYPKSELFDDAQFYLAESYFSEKWYEKAVLEYQTLIAKYTKSNKRPAALYKQGLAFEKLGDTVNAKARFRDVISVYPSSPEAAQAKKKLQ